MPGKVGKVYNRSKARGRERRRLKLGRECLCCRVRDTEVTAWSLVQDYCLACARQRCRVGCCKHCWLPLRRVSQKGGGPSEELCRSCDERRFFALGWNRMYLVSPTDDRERIIWRKTEMPLAKVATVEEWRTTR